MRTSSLKMGFQLACVGMAGVIMLGCRDTGTFVGGGTADMSHGAVPDLTQGAVDIAGTTPDLTQVGGDDGGGMDGGTTKIYIMSSIANMRQNKVGNYELDNVVSITPSEGGKTLKAYVQDAAGGDFSAMQIKCSSGSMTHPCPMTGTVYPNLKNLAAGHSVTVQGTYIKSSMTHIEEFYLDSITDNGNAMMMPAPATLKLADIQRGALTTKTWYQHVNVTLTDSLKVYDMIPAEFLRSAGCMTAGCPCVFGWAMVPSLTMAPAPAMCNGTTIPAMSAPSNMAEVLIGTDFFKQFKLSSDCACAAKYMDTLITTTQTVASGAVISGILSFDSQFMTMNYYQYLAPLQVSDFPIK